MPLHKLNDTPISLKQFYVCAQENAATSVVVHIGLVNEEQHSVEYGHCIAWSHVAPPFRQVDSQEVHAVGWLSSLSESERETVQLFIVRHAEEVSNIRKEKQYVIFPSRTERSMDCPYCRFSCAGFVVEAYRKIDIVLLDETMLPEQSFASLCSYYPSLREYGPKMRASLGLDGNGPWRVVLPGYVLNAFNRTDDEIRQKPFQPKKEYCFLS